MNNRYFYLKSQALLLLICLLTSIGTPAQGLRNLFFNSTQDVIRLDFSTDPPTPWTTGLQGSGAAEGLAHFEDTDGNVIFWFNDQGVYDQTGTLMSGSVGILANGSSAEMCIAVKPDDPCKFYIFYNSETCSNLYYSIIDLSLNGGLGNVTNLNTLLMPGNFSEGFEVIRVPNTCSYWLMTYQCNMGFRRFLVDLDGIQDQGIAHPYAQPPGFDGRGELDYHNGRIGMAFAFSNRVFAANFNALTGEMTNPISLNDNNFSNSPYGVEFSPDGSKMYFSLWYTTPATIYQYNFATAALTEYNPNPGGSLTGLGEIELGRDGKLYVIQDGGNHITVMDNANTVPTFTNITVPNGLGLGISDPIQSDIFTDDPYTTQTLCYDAGSTVILNTQDDLYSYEWRAGNDPTSTPIAEGDSYQFTMGANDTIFLADAVAVSGGCILTATGCGRVRFQLLISPTLDAGNNAVIDPGESYTLQATSTGGINTTYAWASDNASPMDDPTLLQPTISPLVTTMVFGTAQNGTCASSDFMTIYVRTAQYDTLCVTMGQSNTLQLPAGLSDITWVDMANPSVVLGTNETYNHTPTAPITTIRGKGTNANQDGGIVLYLTLVATPALDAGVEQTINFGSSATLNATGGGTNGYTWAANSTLSATNIPNPVASPLATSWYYVSSYSNPICPATDSVRVVVITTTIETDSICAFVGQSTNLSIASDTFSTRRWYDMANPTVSLGTSSSISVTLQANIYATYAAECLTNGGDTVIYYTTLMPNPALTASSAGVAIEGNSVALSVSGGSNYAWTPADLLDNANSATPNTVPLWNDTTFTVTNTTIDGCQNSTTLSIEVVSESIILVPSGFSPNGDGMNDELKLTTFNITELLEFKIFNRWGQLIFETTDLNEAWDGQFLDTDQEMGTYVYLVSAVNKNGEIVEYKGNTTLLR